MFFSGLPVGWRMGKLLYRRLSGVGYVFTIRLYRLCTQSMLCFPGGIPAGANPSCSRVSAISFVKASCDASREVFVICTIAASTASISVLCSGKYFFNFLPRVKIPSAEKLLRFISHWFENFFTDTGFCQVPGFSIRQQFLTGIRQVLPFNP